MQLRLFMIGKVAAPKGGSNTTLAFNWAGDRSVEYASHPVPPDASRGIYDEKPTGTAAAGPLQFSVPAYPIPLNDCSLALPRFRSTGRGKYREGKRRGAGMGAERGTHATGVTTGATGVGGLAGQLTAGARRTSQVTYSAMGSPLATSGRFCGGFNSRRPRSGSVSPGQRSRQRTTPAENCTETMTHGKIRPISCRTAW